MHLEDLAIESIDLCDETYRISEVLDSPPLEKSLREIGQMNPLILAKEGTGAAYILVAGFRRLLALRSIGAKHACARVLSQEDSCALRAFRIALWDNLAHREFRELEKAHALHTLKHTCGVSQDLLVSTYLPLLGLSPHKNILHSFLALHALVPEVKHLLTDGRITPAAAERLAGKKPNEQRSVAAVFEKARWSASLQRQLLELLEELAVTQHEDVGGILARTEISNALDYDGLSPFQKGERVFAILYRWRNPRLSKAEERFRESKQSLGLPGTVKLTPEPYFETPRLRVEFDAPSPERFRELAAAVHRAAESPRLNELFELD